MRKLAGLKPEKVFQYFEELTQIPRGSGDMERVSQYCLDFAEKCGLRAVRDTAYNVVIYKEGTAGYENSDPVILQGHLDMVCQQEEGRGIDFKTEGLDIYVDGDFVKARGTTLGADNGIAIAMAMAILADNSLEHPPIEAVFTTDEEIGMVGAANLDMSKLSGKKMLNIDSEASSVVTVSCAGGADVHMQRKITRQTVRGRAVSVTISGLLGGHSGVDIGKNRVNPNLVMGRVLDLAKKFEGFRLLDVAGGDKSNAIPRCAQAKFVVEDVVNATETLTAFLRTQKEQNTDNEPDFTGTVSALPEGDYAAVDGEAETALLSLLLNLPNGVLEKSPDIEGLVESSANLGILQTKEDEIYLLTSVRSNKSEGLSHYVDMVQKMAMDSGFSSNTNGDYPAWEFNPESSLRPLYQQEFKKVFGFEPTIEAIHAGLECGIFVSGLPGLDCISIGPDLYDIHTPAERLSISSVEKTFEVLLNVLKEIK